MMEESFYIGTKKESEILGKREKEKMTNNTVEGGEMIEQKSLGTFNFRNKTGKGGRREQGG